MSENKLEEAKKIVDEMDKEITLSKAEDLVRDNKIEFEHTGKQYRVRLLNMKEKNELELLRRKKFGQLILDKDILLAKDLRAALQTRGIDLDDLDSQIQKLDAQYKQVSLQLGESLSKNEGDTILKSYEEKITLIKAEKDTLVTQKMLLLNDSLENHLESYVYQVVSYLALEKKVDEKWAKAFASFDDFQMYEDEELINKAGQYSIILQYI
jgi:hypothetical protein